MCYDKNKNTGTEMVYVRSYAFGSTGHLKNINSSVTLSCKKRTSL
jgi:hypothetical protein